MTIKIYNALTHKKEVFETIEKNKVRMYVCGPTVYNYIHIGNARPAVVFDTVRRFLESVGYEVKYVLNFTDVDDKLIKAANEKKMDIKAMSDMYISAYKEDMKQLNVKEATVHPKVTSSIEEIKAMITTLIDKGFAYASAGDVYFSTRHFKAYGKLSGQSLDQLQLGARIDVDTNKKDPVDFVLWKKAKENEIYWESPWGKGRPGWHIECSAMAKAHLGDTIDIHGGGQDLLFPHHENEIAQSESCNDKRFSRYWMHNGYIVMGEEKMSKSLGNVVLTRDLLAEYDGLLVRFFILSVHYRSPIRFSYDLLEQAEVGLKRIKNARLLLKEQIEQATGKEMHCADQVAYLSKKFIEAMNDDFNTANAISVLFETVKAVNTYVQKNEMTKKDLLSYASLIDRICDVLGLRFDIEEKLLDDDINRLIKEREAARINKDFQRSDEIRDQLKAENIILEDTKNGTRWHRG